MNLPLSTYTYRQKKRAALFGGHFSRVMASAAPASDAFDEYMSGAPGKFSNGQIHMNGPGSYQVGVHGGDVPVVLTSMHLVYCGTGITSSSTC